MTSRGLEKTRDWLDGFCLPGQKRFKHPNNSDGHSALVAMIQQIPGHVKVGFEATGGQEWCSGQNFLQQKSRPFSCPRRRSRPSPRPFGFRVE